MSVRQKVLHCFKNIHRARTQVFKEDFESLIAARQRINDEFQKNKGENDPGKINNLILQADEAAEFLRGMVIQAKLNENKGRYEVNITDDTKMYKNIPFDENWEPPKRRKRTKGEQTGCCSEDTSKQ